MLKSIQQYVQNQVQEQVELIQTLELNEASWVTTAINSSIKNLGLIWVKKYQAP